MQTARYRMLHYYGSPICAPLKKIDRREAHRVRTHQLGTGGDDLETEGPQGRQNYVCEPRGLIQCLLLLMNCRWGHEQPGRNQTERNPTYCR